MENYHSLVSDPQFIADQYNILIKPILAHIRETLSEQEKSNIDSFEEYVLTDQLSDMIKSHRILSDLASRVG